MIKITPLNVSICKSAAVLFLVTAALVFFPDNAKAESPKEALLALKKLQTRIQAGGSENNGVRLDY